MVLSRRIAPVFVCLILLFGVSCSKQQAAAASAPDIPTVAVAKVTSEDLSRNLVLTAEFKPFQEIDVMAKVAGYIKEINVDVGDRVQAGTAAGDARSPGDGRRSAPRRRQRWSAATRRWRAPRTNCSAPNRRTRSRIFPPTACRRWRRNGPGWSRSRRSTMRKSQRPGGRGADRGREIRAGGGASSRCTSTTPTLAKVKTLMDYTRVTAPFAGVITKRYADTGSMIQAGTASQTQAMPVVRLSREQPAAADSAGARIGRADGAHRPAGGGAGADAEPQLSRAGGALRRQAHDRHAHHGHRSRRAQSLRCC